MTPLSGLACASPSLRMFITVVICCLSCYASYVNCAPTQKPLKKVTLHLKWLHQFQFAGYYAAVEKGFYRQVGLEVELRERIIGMAPVDGLIGGHAQYAISDTGVVIYRANGIPLIALAAVFQHSPSILLSRADTGIKTLNDLRGKRIRLTSGHMNSELVSMIETSGVAIDDLKLTPSTLTADGLIDGSVDAINAYTTNEPRTLKSRDIPYIAFHPRYYGVNFYGDILITTEAQIARDPQGVKDFREASLRGWRYAVDHPGEVVDIILEKYNSQGKSRGDLLFEARELSKLMLADVVPIGYMNLPRWQHIYDVFTQQGKISNATDLTHFIYPQKQSQSLAELLLLNKTAVATALFTLLAIAMLLHILHLRSQVRARTKDLQKAKERAEMEARTDALTNLPNRRHFMKVLNRDISQAERHGANLVAMEVDIDFFKNVNDQYGHAAGDQALRVISQALEDSIRTVDVVARLGGEEFVITCPNTQIAEARELAERLRRKVEASNIRHEGHLIKITISIGIALFESRENADQLLAHADAALYDAKKSGRNCVRVYNPQEPPEQASIHLKSV